MQDQTASPGGGRGGDHLRDLWQAGLSSPVPRAGARGGGAGGVGWCGRGCVCAAGCGTGGGYEGGLSSARDLALGKPPFFLIFKT